ncbi:MAG: helix-turn-helix transcriptional regulator [Myxococcota bacterium]
MDRTERLLDLVALFLDAQEPVSWARLREAFPDDYGGSADAAERKFERDKAELLELGLPLVYRQGEEVERDGYVVDKNAYYLPEMGLSPEELAVLYAAGSAALASGAFPGSQDLAHALRKIGFFAGAELPTPRVRLELGEGQGTGELSSRLEQLWAATSARKFVDLTYYSPRSEAVTQRRVSPYGLALRRGVWSLVGHCHLRHALRTFHVHRVRELSVNAVRPKSPDFEVPKDFRLDDHVASYPWRHAFHAPLFVRLRLTGELAPLAKGLFPTAEVTPQKTATEVVLRATDLEGLLKYALSLGSSCRVESPPEAVQRHRKMASDVYEAHR